MRIIIAIECKGDEPEKELSRVLNKVTEKISGEDLTAGEYLLTDERVTGKMFIKDAEGFLPGEGYKTIVRTIKEQRRHYASELPISDEL
ncbi:MAG: hypothetical protein DYG83_14825 [Candidatus Brocadia sp. AMX2]|uniref:Cell wall hydrolyses n=1 Tax=Candidatus Brocadia sinica JPN1 TaxID=1197129 RepID=A0ABQ0JZJ4_9BACT|nr:MULTISPECIES: hypothetical protein [Brocadia]MBC6933674.1 hypothetical protein [Candidatus Brocadia sp.]MBL1170465.1 hypothetical protein [Candidatus Brocadia sp. AMX1]NOG40067.1 hypothetical protein [Planctomycetota bacterium]GIK14377.1 MAG: hypothetical protein BroJett002_30840 [Candidatus Brocadia sinica]KAA0243115.1 MAG: hypothetical protein EDM70_11880 [Candidatus Brocadia sp. AMX2]